MVLSRSRGHGFGSPQPIQYGEMIAYLDERGEDDSFERVRAIRLLQDMDSAFMEFLEQKRKAGEER